MLCGQKLKRPLASWSNIIVSPKNNLKANFKQHHRHLSKKIIRKQRNNCGHTFSKVIHVKKHEKKLRSENLIMGKLREGCSWCKRQEKVHLTQNLLREHLSYFHSVTSVVTFFLQIIHEIKHKKRSRSQKIQWLMLAMMMCLVFCFAEKCANSASAQQEEETADLTLFVQMKTRSNIL